MGNNAITVPYIFKNKTLDKSASCLNCVIQRGVSMHRQHALSRILRAFLVRGHCWYSLGMRTNLIFPSADVHSWCAYQSELAPMAYMRSPIALPDTL
jgi:hypothetical protein